MKEQKKCLKSLQLFKLQDEKSYHDRRGTKATIHWKNIENSMIFMHSFPGICSQDLKYACQHLIRYMAFATLCWLKLYIIVYSYTIVSMNISWKNPQSFGKDTWARNCCIPQAFIILPLIQIYTDTFFSIIHHLVFIMIEIKMGFLYVEKNDQFYLWFQPFQHTNATYSTAAWHLINIHLV